MTSWEHCSVRVPSYKALIFSEPDCTRHFATLTLTAEATSSGSCTSSPSLQVYKQSITFLFSSLPERMISPARLPRKNWAIRAFPPGYVRTGNEERINGAQKFSYLRVHSTDFTFSGLTACWHEWSSCKLVCVPLEGLRPRGQADDGWAYTCLHAIMGWTTALQRKRNDITT